MQTVNISGYVDDGDGSGAASINLMLVNRANIDLQYNSVTDAGGNYKVAVEPGYYDVYLNGSNFGGVIFSGKNFPNDMVSNWEMIANITGQPVISGVVFLEAGGYASGYEVGLISGDGNSLLATTTVNENGNFSFQTCPIGYYELRIGNGNNLPYFIPMPVPEVNVSITIIMLNEQIADSRLIATDTNEMNVGQPFSVCRLQPSGIFNFIGGVLTGGVVTYMSTPNLVKLNVYTAPSSNPLFNYAIYVDLRQNPFYAMPPSGNYSFYDASGDKNDLLAFWPYLHSVNYNSPSPDIVRVTFSALFGAPDYWPNAPNCPNTND